MGRLRYRLYRHPIVMFGLGPAYLFILRHRLPIGVMCGGCQPWLSSMATNASIAALVAIVIWFVGVGPFLLVHLPIAFLAASIGGWLFYVQHKFEGTLWAEDLAWNLHAAALHGSSHYDLPGILRWFTANLGVHHSHHLCSRIPYYRLPRVLQDHPELGATGRLTLIESLKCVRLVLWDESRGRLVSFRDMREYRAHAEPLCSGLSRPRTHVAEERPCGEPPVRRERSRGTCEDGERAHRPGERREPFAELGGARDKPH